MSTQDINTMEKDELADFAFAEFGLEINKRQKIETLRAQVQAAIDKTNGTAPPEPEEEVTIDTPVGVPVPIAQVTHFKHPSNNRVYPSTRHLVDHYLRYQELLPCDGTGQVVPVVLPPKKRKEFA